ncbi:hypothetical protein C1637_05370 [Chryseobacterium lactis]|uniref:Natural product n=2 Tax=Chryseobacterium lactis TaxID=1241981 RepID=A0A3G6RLA7_CHRLC|nr:hypothetical protein EG342_21340 [Chryseobacterium lactis]AZB04663.1 hypothetical protein EG341_12220 [Chryseobacterium lactis]PNW14394.1 hypothetical protein C1637_05370 [Chryseobacterium lactis]
MTIKDNSQLQNIKSTIMKKLKLNKGLQINKEAISKLQDEQIKSIKGGAAAFSCVGGSCNNNTKEATKLQDPS